MFKSGTILLLSINMLMFFFKPVGAEIDIPLSPLNTPLSLFQNSGFDNVRYPQAANPAATAESPAKSISKTKAVAYSMLLPGAGHFYLDKRGKGEVFMGAEVVLWAGFFAFRSSGSWKKDDYIRFAEIHAGVDPSGKDDDFYKNLTFYDSRDQYNSSGRIINPGAPYYPPGQSYYWKWDSESSRLDYRQMRNSSEAAYRNATFMIVGAIINRILAGVDSYRLAQKISARSLKQFGAGNHTKLNISANPFGANPRFFFKVSRKF
jgi:hypothetical protein